MKKILIFEDDHDLLEIMEIILQPHKVISQNSLHDFKTLVQKEQPALILMDLRIPDIGGSEATKKLKNNKKLQHIPVVLISADGSVEEECHRCGADAFIRKPFEVEEFEAVVNRFL